VQISHNLECLTDSSKTLFTSILVSSNNSVHVYCKCFDD